MESPIARLLKDADIVATGDAVRAFELGYQSGWDNGWDKKSGYQLSKALRKEENESDESLS